MEDVRRLEALAEHLDSCFDELLSECSLACAARVRVETLACADRLEVVDPDCENFIGKEDGLLEGIQRNRACRRIGVLMPGDYELKCKQCLAENWTAAAFMDCWMGKLFNLQNRSFDMVFARGFMHKLRFCESEDFLTSWPFWSLHH